MTMSGGDIVNKIAELRYKYPKESDKDWARRIYKFVNLELKKWILIGQVPIWLVWEHENLKELGDLQISHLRAICTTNELALKYRTALENQVRPRRINIRTTRLNHLFAWSMIQKTLEKEKK